MLDRSDTPVSNLRWN